jgi:hypothetical protein
MHRAAKPLVYVIRGFHSTARKNMAARGLPELFAAGGEKYHAGSPQAVGRLGVVEWLVWKKNAIIAVTYLLSVWDRLLSPGAADV